MYETFFGFREKPFNLTPDPRFLYLSPKHNEAFAHLDFGLKQRGGFMVVTGEVGTGKTTLLNAFRQKLDPSVRCAYLFNTRLTPDDFFIYLLEELDLEKVVPFRKSIALQRLNHYLIERLREGKKTLLIIDEAQNLSVDLLEEVRMLSNLETPESKLIQIMLVGQPELDHKLCRPEIRQLLQRVELRHRIRELNARETAEYVRQRLQIAGHENGELFTGAALRAVHRYSGGIPRMINVLCDNALLLGFVRKLRKLSAGVVAEAVEDMRIEPRARARPITLEEMPPRDSWLRRLWMRRRTPDGAGA